MSTGSSSATALAAAVLSDGNGYFVGKQEKVYGRTLAQLQTVGLNGLHLKIETVYIWPSYLLNKKLPG